MESNVYSEINGRLLTTESESGVSLPRYQWVVCMNNLNEDDDCILANMIQVMELLAIFTYLHIGNWLGKHAWIIKETQRQLKKGAIRENKGELFGMRYLLGAIPRLWIPPAKFDIFKDEKKTD